MGSKTIRIGIGTANGPRSIVWRVTHSKSDVYVSRGARGKEKLSFHKSEICRRAFNSEYEMPKTLSDRAVQKWRRAPTLPAGSGHFSYAAIAIFPTDFLSTVLPPEPKQVIWIPSAPASKSTVLEFFFTRESKAVVESYGPAQGRTVFSYMPLPNGEAFVVSTYILDFPGQEFVVPASLGAQRDVVVCAVDSNRTGRPLRMTVFQDATDSRPATITEYGAYRMPKGTPYSENMGMLTRQLVIDRDGDKW